MKLKNKLLIPALILTFVSIFSYAIKRDTYPKPSPNLYLGENNKLLNIVEQSVDTKKIVEILIGSYYHPSGEEEYLKNAILELSKKILVKDKRWVNIYKEYSNLRLTPFQERFAIQNNDGQLNFSMTSDYLSSLVIRLPATGKYIGKDFSVAVQAHLDMVLDHEDGLKGDELRKLYFNGIPTVVDSEGWLKSEGKQRSIGADNITGVAELITFMLSPELERPALELVFTSGEEADWHLEKHHGRSYLFGARFGNLQLTSKVLLNVDSSDGPGSATMGSVGGDIQTVKSTFPAQTVNADEIIYDLEISGLKGGHSGKDIHKNRKNALLVLSKILVDQPVKLIHMEAGAASKSKIPSQAKAKFVLTSKAISKEKLESDLSKKFVLLLNANDEVAGPSEDSPSVNEQVQLKLENVTNKTIHGFKSLSGQDSKQILSMLATTKNRVFKYKNNGHFPHGLKSSFNYSIFRLNNDLNESQFDLQIDILARSLVLSEFDELEAYLSAHIKNYFPAKLTRVMGWPAWEVDLDTNWLAQLVKSKMPFISSIKATNGGLEANMILHNHHTNLGVSMPLGAVSLAVGPKIEGKHSYREKILTPTINESFTQTKSILKVVAEELVLKQQ